jgi:hypothetical protein
MSNRAQQVKAPRVPDSRGLRIRGLSNLAGQGELHLALRYHRRESHVRECTCVSPYIHTLRIPRR